jgi:hypothetical protein
VYANTAYVAPAIITGPMASPSRPSVRLTALAAPTTTRRANGTYQKAEVGPNVLQERHGERAAVPGPQVERRRRGARDRELGGEADAARDALRVLARDLRPVVEEADEAVAERHGERDPHVPVGEVGQHDRRQDGREEDERAAHRGRPAFTWCVAGPSERIDCPIWSAESRRMSVGPRTSDSVSAASAATSVRNVM